MSTDRIRFLKSPDTAVGAVHFGWDGPWPPPKRMVMVVGALTGGMAVCDPEDPTKPQIKEWLAEIAESGSEITYFKLDRHSEMDTAAPEGARWCRAADYLPEEG